MLLVNTLTTIVARVDEKFLNKCTQISVYDDI